VLGCGFQVQDKVQHSRCRVQGLGFSVEWLPAVSVLGAGAAAAAAAAAALANARAFPVYCVCSLYVCVCMV
jgi:hypothetical protein